MFRFGPIVIAYRSGVSRQAMFRPIVILSARNAIGNVRMLAPVPTT